ncbi:hypothetical protein [Archangium sp.]|uniref:hypothetical protein n=1 Tax=Archangium sp. TaxID=1872627 RepID=UPI002D4E30E8|nr:hypothetical protein [Archangium sp.]HYO52609.1 hypothetical protein [Archangium sp.]
MELLEPHLSREIREVEQALRGLFTMQLDDGQLRQGMEELGKRWVLPGLIALWGPGLYNRNRTVFRPFILAHFPQFTFDTLGRVRSVFEGPTAELFEKWLADVERHGDVELFRRLYRLRFQDLSWEAGRKRWLGDLMTRYGAAPTRASRQVVLSQLELHFELDEPLARERGDEALAFDIYRRQVPEISSPAAWRSRTSAVSTRNLLRGMRSSSGSPPSTSRCWSARPRRSRPGPRACWGRCRPSPSGTTARWCAATGWPGSSSSAPTRTTRRMHAR